MFNYNSFMQPQNSSPLRAKPLQNYTPYFPTIQPTLDSSSHLPLSKEEPQNNDELPYNIRILLENEEELQTTASNSEKIDKTPDVSQGIKAPLTKGWGFGQDEIGRAVPKTFQADSTVNQKITSSPVKGNLKTWPPALPGKVSIKPSYFEPLNPNMYTPGDKRAYFITLEGFHLSSLKRFFKIEKLCHGLQERNLNGEKDIRQVLYMNLWNDWQNGQNGTENIFEPWIYAVPYMQFRLVVTINMSHAYEDPYVFDFSMDLTQFAINSKETRTQSLEVAYTEQGNMSNIANNLTLCLQVTNEKLFAQQGLRMGQDPRQKVPTGKQEMPEECSVILKHILIRLPLSRTESVNSHISSPLMQNKVSTSDSYANTASTNSQGVEQTSPQKSWSNFSPDDSPSRKSAQFKQGTPEKTMLPPGLLNNKGTPSSTNYVAGGGSMFKFKAQQRMSFQLVGERRVSEELMAKSKYRMSSDFSQQGERNPLLKDLESYIKTNKSGNRRESNTSDGSAFSCFTTLSRVQQYSSTGISENEPESPRSSLNSSLCGGSMAELGEEENSAKSNNDMTEEFRVEDYVGKMVEFAKTSHGSKILQKYVATADKEDLDVVVEELGEKINELMLDPHANYMIQTLVQNGSPKQRLHLLQKISPCLITIARDKKGTHSLQAIVALIDTEEEFSLIKKTLDGSVFELSMDPRANYVIQKLINTIPIDSSHFLYQPLFNNFVQMANNSFGLLVLKQMMARVEQRETLKQKIVELTCLNFEKLIQNPFGNYAIQHIVEFYPKESHIIKSKMLTKIIPYSSQKISSNVIEKCLTVCDSQFRRRVIEEILKNGRLGDLMKNKYGNFVTLQLLATASLIDKQRLMQAIFKYANSFNGTKYKTRWLKFVEENPLSICWNGNANAKQEGDLSKEQNKVQSSDQVDASIKEKELIEPEAKTKEMDLEIVEAIKKSWREITKDEKSDPSPFSSRKATAKKQQQHYNKREEFFYKLA
jgi:hypothetical protein